MNKKLLLETLSSHQIIYKIYNHPALYTVKDSLEKRGLIEGAHTKNLFLKNKKNQFFLISCLESTIVDLKILKKKLNLGNISFAKDMYLQKILGVEPGSVTPFGLLNDFNNKIVFYMDQKILTFENVNFHPLVNTSTLSLNTKQFLTFMNSNNILVNIYNFDNYEHINE